MVPPRRELGFLPFVTIWAVTEILVCSLSLPGRVAPAEAPQVKQALGDVSLDPTAGARLLFDRHKPAIGIPIGLVEMCEKSYLAGPDPRATRSSRMTVEVPALWRLLIRIRRHFSLIRLPGNTLGTQLVARTAVFGDVLAVSSTFNHGSFLFVIV
jgi:hypothetical protein